MLYIIIIILMALKCKNHKVGTVKCLICYYIPEIKLNTQFYTCSSYSVSGLNDKGSYFLHHEYETKMLIFLSSEFKRSNMN